MNDLTFAGSDELGREVQLAFVARFADVANLAFPGGPFVVLLGGDTAKESVDVIYSTAELLLERGAVYVMCWGEGAARCEDIVDEAVVMRSIATARAPEIMTTAHEDESLREALEFATTVAVPSEPLSATCRDVLLVFHGDVRWYNEARRLLEEMLGDRAE